MPTANMFSLSERSDKYFPDWFFLFSRGTLTVSQ